MIKRGVMLVVALVMGLPGAAWADDPFEARVYATREGLIGEVTANGHRIASEDLFAALPSRLGLAGRNQGNRTVRVCTATRCVFIPVWDVGPWNTKDDYWNANRQMWKDLPRGKPAAQAAYADGYNRGRDEFGRTVSNPAGIDLADRAFRDGLGLRDNAWVRVAFLWTTPGPRGSVATDGSPLLVRDKPSRTGAVVGFAAGAAQLPISCQIRGEQITGEAGATDLWDRVAPGKYVSHAFVATPAGFTAPPCTPAP
ncbi:hypothetical protein HDA40_004261 [Hamadaea flava]|uniref:Uncharacterized protein n=1 Tax=Hamadaea flava TaxID=1742688 RepID=A0ABV8M1U5_9ACTN|nr:hypothetical protein [Hamadaea flava]MCP2325754.1 hypothetical protein [Hamadaea flava]